MSGPRAIGVDIEPAGRAARYTVTVQAGYEAMGVALPGCMSRTEFIAIAVTGMGLGGHSSMDSAGDGGEGQDQRRNNRAGGGT